MQDPKYSCTYLEFYLRKHALKNFVMFAHNSGEHWIFVIIATKWKKVFYLDSAPRLNSDFEPLKKVIDE